MENISMFEDWCNKTNSQCDAYLDIEEMKNLTHGWDFGDGRPITDYAQKTCLVFLKDVSSDFTTEALPESDGGIELIIGREEKFLTVQVPPDDSLTFDVARETGIGAYYTTEWEKFEIFYDEVILFLTEFLNQFKINED